VPAENGLPVDECEVGHCCWNSLPACAGWAIDESENDIGPESFQPQAKPPCPWREAEIERVEWEPPVCKPVDSPCHGLRLRAKFLKRFFKEVEASRACVRTTFIILILAFASVFFSQDTQNLVVAPIEKMVNIVKQLADDPLRRPELPDEDDELAMEGPGQKKKPTGQLETTMLETTILKIGGLLRIGFGEAGALIIGKNMAAQAGTLNIMRTGKAVDAVYGFVGIADFAELTECLLEEVMVFVNKIARIVHTSTNEWYGAANKNMGDSFFLIWTLPSDEVMQKMSSQREAMQSSMTSGTEQPAPEDEFDMSYLADAALLSSIKIVAEIRRASDLSAYSKHPKIIPKFGMSYRVSVTLGVHVGWSIEGVIGSEHKIDASYLSPHVNLCAALERVARRIYNTEIIISQQMAELLSAVANEKCRLIDCAKILGSIDAQEIYTFDIHKEVVTMAPDQHQLGAIIAPADMSQAELASKGMDAYWEFDQDVVQLQSDVTSTFLASWEQAYRLYVSGDWQVAAEVLNKISTNFPIFDGPTQAILQYMLSYDLMPPDDWSGFRIIRLPK
jgi:class 3 adenylate cyclase